ncbi:Multicopper oxidase [Methylophaga frappieri]|uniref:Multicopper oxidase n=1 Tax=Methylophaga frappieri (strain ATCC BAA-2434 / DSM 25690 / JAM7) TaxID=754477 RepID=I1YJY1_METFJ|nr:copper resistance system multicopper oxidase [Methylophaga frappieri]AFJ03224.1 Multicopper oxidase [Methylophaga frappieri]
MFLSLRMLTGLLICLMATTAIAKTTEYHLVVAYQTVNVTGKSVQKIAVNGQIPGPVLNFTEGDTAIIHVENKLDQPTSVHWHGLLLPPEMDGVPGLGGFKAIPAGETFTYQFDLRQNGTYWYHAHSGTQEQEGHYGALIVHPAPDPKIQADRDYVIVLSDFSEETGQQILANLKKSPHYYNYTQRTVGDFMRDVDQHGWSSAWQTIKNWGSMRMSPTDLADVGYDAFLLNGHTHEQNWTGLFSPGERIRLRFINASAMSFYDVRIPGLKMTVVQADGRYVEPVTVDEFRFGVAETYDVIVTPTSETAYTIAAESIDRTGFATGTLAPHLGMRGEMPAHRPRSLLTMADMGHHHGSHGHHVVSHNQDDLPPSGWAEAGTPIGHKALQYADLRALEPQEDIRPPSREIEIVLGGNMQRYIWTLNDKKFTDADFEPIQLQYGERVRLVFINETMMAHPMHLHGMFVQLDNGQPAATMPDKHTVNVPPGERYAVLLTADEPGEWAFHCHLLYHMSSGMMSQVIVAEYGTDLISPASNHGAHHDHH